MQTKGLFLDRDGTLIHDLDYLSDPKDVQLIVGTHEALNQALSLGFKLFLFTNQSGIARGYYSLESVNACNQKMLKLLNFKRDIFEEICIAPEGPDETPIYRKPSPKFIHEMLHKYNLDKANSYMVGDRLSDIQAGLNAGIKAVRVETGKIITSLESEWINNKKILSFKSLIDFIRSLTIH